MEGWNESYVYYAWYNVMTNWGYIFIGMVRVKDSFCLNRQMWKARMGGRVSELR